MSGQWVGGNRLRKRKGRKKNLETKPVVLTRRQQPLQGMFILMTAAQITGSPDWYAPLTIWPPDTSYYLLAFFLIKKRFRFVVLGVNQLLPVLLNIKITGQVTTVHPPSWTFTLPWPCENERLLPTSLSDGSLVIFFFLFWSMNYRSRENEWATMAI